MSIKADDVRMVATLLDFAIRQGINWRAVGETIQRARDEGRDVSDDEIVESAQRRDAARDRI